MLVAEFLSKLLFFSKGMSPDPALKHHFELRLNWEWSWWICVWVIVLSFTLGGLLGDNPLLGETRPNTTSLISLLRPCCFVATESHSQLSAAAPVPTMVPSLPLSLTTIYTVPWLTSLRATAIALGICNQEPSELRLCLCPHVPPYPPMSRGWLRMERKADHDNSGFAVSYRLTAGPQHEAAAHNAHGFKHSSTNCQVCFYRKEGRI